MADTEDFPEESCKSHGCVQRCPSPRIRAPLSILPIGAIVVVEGVSEAHCDRHPQVSSPRPEPSLSSPPSHASAFNVHHDVDRRGPIKGYADKATPRCVWTLVVVAVVVRTMECDTMVVWPTKISPCTNLMLTPLWIGAPRKIQSPAAPWTCRHEQEPNCA